MAFVAPQQPISFQQPDWDVPESEKTQEWWISNLRFFSTYFNRPYNAWNTDNPTENLSPVNKGLDYMLYYLGKQKNIDYNHVTQSDGQTLQAVWVKSKKVKTMIDMLAGMLLEQLNGKEISAKSISERAVSAKIKKWEDVMIQYDSQAIEVFDQLKEIGIEYVPPFGRKFDTKEEAERFLTYDFKDSLEEVAVDLGREIEWRNDTNTLLIEAFKQDYAPSNYMGVLCYVENGKVKQKKIPFYNLIYDIASDDPILRDQRFAGYIEYLTPQQIDTRWKKKLTPTELQEIKQVTLGGDYSNSFMNFYNTGDLKWWTHRRDNMTVTAVTVYWIAPRDTRYMYDDKNGEKRLMKAGKKEGEKAGDYIIDDVHYATLLGNKYLVDYGYMKNVVRPFDRKDFPELPIKVLNGNTTIGDGVSLIGSIAQVIDKMDFYQFQLMKMCSAATGKSYIINGNKMGEGIKSKELITDLKTMNLHVTTGTTGESDDTTNRQNMVEVVDMTLDPTIRVYIELYMQLDEMVNEIMSLPRIAQGFQTNVIGKGVQQKTIAQSSLGLASLFENLFKFNKLLLQYSVNLAKQLYANDDKNEYAPMIVGERGMKVIKITKDYMFEDVLIDISPRDIITEQQRVSLTAMAQAWAQNGLLNPMDYLQMLKSDTLTELENDWEYSIRDKERKEKEQQQAQYAQQQQMLQMQLQANQQTEGFKQAALDERAEQENQTKLAQEMMKQEGQKQKTQNAI